MSVADETEPVRPTHVLYRCRRCTGLHQVEHADPEGRLTELVTTLRTIMTVRCDDGALAVADIVGCGPGQWPPPVPKTPDGGVVVTEKGKAPTGRMTGAERAE